MEFFAFTEINTQPKSWDWRAKEELSFSQEPLEARNNGKSWVCKQNWHNSFVSMQVAELKKYNLAAKIEEQ